MASFMRRPTATEIDNRAMAAVEATIRKIMSADAHVFSETHFGVRCRDPAERENRERENEEDFAHLDPVRFHGA